MKNGAGTSAKLKTHRLLHIIIQHKDAIKLDKTSTLISHSLLHIL